MKVTITGSGPKLVLIHGWASSARLMGLLAADLDASFECHCIDLPGHGAAAEGRIDVGLEGMIEQAAGYVRLLGEPVVLVGWAMGALISLAVASRASVRGVICIGTPSGGAEYGPAFEKMASRLVRDWPRYVRSSVDAITGGNVSPEMHAFLCQVMQATSPSLARKTLLEVAQTDPLGFAREVVAPALILHGEEDQISPVAIASSLKEAMPEAILKTYPGTGHAPFLEKRDETIADIRQFLEQLDV